MNNAPRFVLGGTNSGCGKTTVSCALMQAYQNRGVEVAAFKCGPDYIDPMFHSRVIGARSRNLDAFLCRREQIPRLLSKNAGALSIIEGVMGYYDGMGGISAENSTADLAVLTDSPTVLVLNARGMSLSAAALLRGFLDFSQNTIRGVILNGIRPMMTDYYASIIESNTGLTVYGSLPDDPDCAVESRHLGLVTAQEIEDLREKLNRLAQHAEQGIDLDRLRALAQTAPPLADYVPPEREFDGVRIAAAQDEAFCFTYADGLDVFRELGAEIVPFSPLHDTELPKNIAGLYLCGGYPELYAHQLSANRTMLESVRMAVRGGLPTVAECGGFLYLHDTLEGERMAGICGGAGHLTDRLGKFGYVELTARRDNPLCAAGDTLHAHEFHYCASADEGDAFCAQKPGRKRSWSCVHAGETLYAGYPHIHFAGQPEAARRFLRLCERYQQDI